MLSKFEHDEMESEAGFIADGKMLFTISDGRTYLWSAERLGRGLMGELGADT
jgi:hypothetical protein